jgi:hypothetical protein
MLAGRGGNRDGEAAAGPKDPGQLSCRAVVVVDVLHDLGADRAVEVTIPKRKGEGVALEHAREPLELAPAAPQGRAPSTQRIAVQVEADHARAPGQGPEAVTPLAAAGIEEQVTGPDAKPLEVDGE